MASDSIPVDTTALVAIVRDALPSAIAIYLFGSYAKSTERHDSDLDLAVLADRPLAAIERFELQERLAAAVRRDVDLVDLRGASTVLAVQVVAHGQVLACFDAPARAWFEMHAYSGYARLNEERAEILDRITREHRIHD